MTYTLQMKYVFEMQQAAGSLSPVCQAAYGADAWKCIMAPYASPFITTPWFALQVSGQGWGKLLSSLPFITMACNTFRTSPPLPLQSRFDHWQLSEELFMPCMQVRGETGERGLYPSSTHPFPHHQAQSYGPPFKPSTCTPKEVADIQVC